MADENRSDINKSTHDGRIYDAPIAGRATGSAYTEDRFSGPYSPYGSTAGSPDTHMGGTQPIPIKKGLFDGISVAQVIAASAAAATSMLLASRIGIAGSVIGAAVSSMVTVICSQLYRNALDASARKLKAKQVSHAYEQDALRGYANAEVPSAADSPDSVGAPRIRIAPTKLQARAAAERSASKRKVAIVSALIAIAAVAACAGVIMLTTSGQGLGTKAPSVFANRVAESEPSPEMDTAPDEPVENPTAQPNPDTPDVTPAKPVEGTDTTGTPSTDGDSTAGSTANGAPGAGDAPQQNGTTSDANDATAGQSGEPGVAAGDTSSAAAGKKTAPSS